ncbi:MAG: lipase [Chloroflexi bacterium]|nr:lipase [Chloroflexota bacterium]
MRLCFVGDSLVNGTGDPDCLGWSGRICAAANRAGHDLTYYNLGIRRDTSADVLARWEREVGCRLPADFDGRVVFSFGTNDCTVENGRPRVAFDDSLANAKAILARAIERYPTLMIGPPPTCDPDRNRTVARLSRAYERVCRALGVSYLEVFSALEAGPSWLREAAANDGAHPRAGGYTELAALVDAWSGWRDWLDD